MRASTSQAHMKVRSVRKPPTRGIIVVTADRFVTGTASHIDLLCCSYTLIQSLVSLETGAAIVGSSCSRDGSGCKADDQAWRSAFRQCGPLEEIAQSMARVVDAYSEG